MLLKRCLICASVFLAFAACELLAKAAQIVVHLNDGRQMAGELHSVSASSLVVSRGVKPAPNTSPRSARKKFGKLSLRTNPKLFFNSRMDGR
ncbi:MAG: hypothetical protein ACREOI_13535 [bacterium]